MKDLIPILISGGQSLRMWPLSDKHFLKFLGKTLVSYSLLQLKRFGARKVVVVVNQANKEAFSRLISNFPEMSIKIVLQTDQRGIAGAIVSCAKLITGKSILVINPADIYEDILLSDFDKLLATSPQMVLAGTHFSTYFPGGYLTVVEGEVTSIVEKPDPTHLPSKIVTFVFDYFETADLLLRSIEKVETKEDDVFEKAIGTMIAGGITCKFLPYKGFWGYLKYPWHALNITSYYLTKVEEEKDKGVVIDKSAIVRGKVYFGQNVRVLENAKIIGPTFIGRGTVIGNNVLVRESIIGEGCVIGLGTEITRSYIGDNCWFHSNYIGDAVILNNVSLGAGSILANFRLDEGPIKSFVLGKSIETGKVKLGAIIGENVRIGVNASLMPGVKIGKNSFVGAGVVLDKDLADGKFCLKKETGYKIVDNRKLLSPNSRKEQREKLKF